MISCRSFTILRDYEITRRFLIVKIDHLTGSVTNRGGGIPIALHALLGAQREVGGLPRLIGWDDDGEAVGDWPDGALQALRSGRCWGLSSAEGMRGVVREGQARLLHLHGLWTDASRVTLGQSLPYVVSPHGMLDSWALQHSALKKKVATAWFEGRNLRRAACIHALCQSEAESIRQFGLYNPIAIIPNGVTLPKKAETEPLKPETKTLLFLGRIHPKKGLANALEAWCRGQEAGGPGKEEWQWVIAGWDQGGHENELKEQCREAGVSVDSVPLEDFLSEGPKPERSKKRASVVFVGAAFGNHKEELLRRADAFVLPSFSEGLPMAILEAWSYGLPVLMTDHCNLPEGFDHQAAIRIGTESDSIAQGLSELMQMSAAQRSGMGQRGRHLVEAKFTWPQVAEQMMKVYEWVLGRREKPECVVECRARSEK